MGEDESYRKSKLTAILVVVLISVALLVFILVYTLSSASDHHRKSAATFNKDTVVRGVCRASRDPSACRASLSSEWKEDSGAAPVLQAINASLQISNRHLNTSINMVGVILAKSADNQNRSDTSKVCLEILRYAEHRVHMASADALPRKSVKDARSWVSAALAYQYGCMSGLKNVNDTPLVADTVGFFNSTLIGSTADALAIMANYDYFGDKTGSWGPPKTERDGFWPSGSKSSTAARGGIPSGMTANVTVCGSGGGCDYETVQKAVDAAPANSGARFVIWIKAGVYEETVRVAFEKKNVVLLGDGMGKTVITGSMNVGQPRVSTYNSATVGKAFIK